MQCSSLMMLVQKGSGGGNIHCSASTISWFTGIHSDCICLKISNFHLERSGQEEPVCVCQTIYWTSSSPTLNLTEDTIFIIQIVLDPEVCHKKQRAKGRRQHVCGISPTKDMHSHILTQFYLKACFRTAGGKQTGGGGRGQTNRTKCKCHMTRGGGGSWTHRTALMPRGEG